MSASLVGSEMCIRDSPADSETLLRGAPTAVAKAALATEGPSLKDSRSVSYTHLTLPTICSV
eukprot:12574973-Alexandrium_andersonii.AAC.1